MCTCLTLKTDDFYFGRNLDLEYRFNESVVVTPRNYEFKLKNGDSFKTLYSIIGMATVMDDYPFYAEASNEEGLCMAGLYFPGNAFFFDPKENKVNIAPFELIPYFLGNYKSVKEIKKMISDLNITNIAYCENMPVTELHYMISDKDESIVIEQMKDGLHVYENKLGVLTNNPPFNYQLMNLNNYLNLSNRYPDNKFSDKLDLNPLGVGFGSIGLPGDNSPQSRFVRMTFNKFNSRCDGDLNSSVSQFFHLLDSVSMVQGTVITKANMEDITTYSCCINVTKGIYFYKTYNNNQLTAIKLNKENMNNDKLSVYPLIEEQQINYLNK